MSEKNFTIFLVDDDAGVLTALSRLLRAKGYNVQPFVSPQDFLAERDATAPGCAILDLTMPGIDGLNLQQSLSSEASLHPVIFLTGTGDIPTSVRAMRAGALDFLTKPVEVDALFSAIARAEAQNAEARAMCAELASIQTKMATLTKRESEVLVHVVAGKLNKQIAHDLGTVEKTIKVHRGRMMQKLGVHTVADLVRLAEKVGIRGDRNSISSQSGR
jgi:FixJ family two-component response regulator